MTNNKSDLHINFLPLILITVVIVIFIVAASLWNQVRTQVKLSKIQTHTEAIYNAHQDEFVSTIKTNNQLNSKNFLGVVNAPEKGIYDVKILIKNKNGQYTLQDGGANINLDTNTTDKLNSLLSNEHSVSTKENILNTNQYDDDLYAFMPIKDNNESNVLGFVVVAVRRDQNI